MGFFSKKQKDVVIRWSPESDLNWAKQKANTLYKPMKSVRCGGVLLIIQSLSGAADGMRVTVGLSNLEEKAVGFNTGGFGLIYGDYTYRCDKLKACLGRRDMIRDSLLGNDPEGEEVRFRDAVVNQFQEATFTAHFDAPVPSRSFAIVVEAKRLFAPNVIFVTPYEESELADYGLA